VLKSKQEPESGQAMGGRRNSSMRGATNSADESSGSTLDVESEFSARASRIAGVWRQ
jgi:hypothetical protein